MSMSTELTKGQRASMQAALELRRKALEQQIEQQLGGRSRSEHAREVLLQDGDDAPARDADREVDLARTDQEGIELRAVADALARLAAGTYGLCCDCEDPIPFDRLQHHPEVLRCVPCQSKHETTSGQGVLRTTI
jgi:DnaK suppressor protein